MLRETDKQGVRLNDYGTTVMYLSKCPQSKTMSGTH